LKRYIPNARFFKYLSLCCLTKIFSKGNISAGQFPVRQIHPSLLSSSAATEACTQLAILLNDYLLSAIVQTTYNEWGALLFLDEINLICQYVDQLCTQMDDNSEIKEALGPIKWAAKILALDQPGDIRKYNIVQGSSSSRPFRKLDEALVRDIMSRRVDFSKDVVSKIKINIA
jgi:hypothetical protein